MALWQGAAEDDCKPCLLSRVRIDGWRDPIGHKGFETAVVPPFVEDGSILQELDDIRLVVSLETDRLVVIIACDQSIEHSPGCRSTVDVVPKKDLNGPKRGVRR